MMHHALVDPKQRCLESSVTLQPAFHQTPSLHHLQALSTAVTFKANLPHARGPAEAPHDLPTPRTTQITMFLPRIKYSMPTHPVKVLHMEIRVLVKRRERRVVVCFRQQCYTVVRVVVADQMRACEPAQLLRRPRPVERGQDAVKDALGG